MTVPSAQGNTAARCGESDQKAEARDRLGGKEEMLQSHSKGDGGQ
jgi:hypothetical protein